MSALSDASTPAQDAAPPSIDTQQLQNNDGQNGSTTPANEQSARKRTFAVYCNILEAVPCSHRTHLLIFTSESTVRPESLCCMSCWQDKMQRGSALPGEFVVYIQ